VYNHHSIKSHFDCYGWTSISQQLNTREVLQKYQEMLAVHLGKRYLVVLDDIWSPKDWDVLKSAFPKRKGSKIMVTMRNKKLSIQIYGVTTEQQSLTDDEAWELLCKKAFPPNVADSRCFFSSDKEKCGKDMVKKCGGRSSFGNRRSQMLISKLVQIKTE
ncbi:LOW QUALITY PROTEIN: hypothetical protein AQUCO_05500064v1, partial [Aquilegia coerulea]